MSNIIIIYCRIIYLYNEIGAVYILYCIQILNIIRFIICILSIIIYIIDAFSNAYKSGIKYNDNNNGYGAVWAFKSLLGYIYDSGARNIRVEYEISF